MEKHSALIRDIKRSNSISAVNDGKLREVNLTFCRFFFSCIVENLLSIRS